MSSDLKYVVIYSYNAYIGYEMCAVLHATEEAIEQDGNNIMGRNETYEVNCFETLEKAIKMAKYWAPSLQFGDDFSEEEYREAARVINDLIHDEKYCGRFLNKEVATKDFTRADIKTIEVNSQKNEELLV